MAMWQQNIDTFIRDLSSDKPVPGGGGASALSGAIGMSLGNMVLALTTGKKKYAQYQDEIEELIPRADALTKELLEGMDKDAEAFAPLAEAYSLPKDTEEEKQKRALIMEKALYDAAKAPLDLMERLLAAITLIHRIAQIGSKLAISDAGVAAQMCKAAMNGASLNVYINTGLMQDKETAAKMNAQAEALVNKADTLADEAFCIVMKQLRG